MALFLWELKKIWRPGILAALVLLGGMYYYLFPSFYIEYFCNGSGAQAEFDLAAGWVEKYGPTMEPDERAELDGQRDGEIAVFNEQVVRIPEALEAGITSYDSFAAFRHDHYESAMEGSEDKKDKEDKEDKEYRERLLWRIINNTNYDRITALERFMEVYDLPPDSLREEFSVIYTPKEQARILELEGQGRGYLPFPVQVSTAEYGKDLAVWIVLSVGLLLSPTLVRDRLHWTRQAQ